ncbi:mCG140577, partial [Mus musculus]
SISFRQTKAPLSFLEFLLKFSSCWLLRQLTKDRHLSPKPGDLSSTCLIHIKVGKEKTGIDMCAHMHTCANIHMCAHVRTHTFLKNK